MSQSDPTFRTTGLYSPLTTAEVHRRLIEPKNYNVEQLPTVGTISNKLNELGIALIPYYPNAYALTPNLFLGIVLGR